MDTNLTSQIRRGEMKTALSSDTKEIFLVLLFSTVLFYFLFGLKILNPTYTDWLYVGDYYQNYASIVMYRFSHIGFPLGDIYNADSPVGANIIFSDGNLLLGFILKALSPVLPAKAQIYGLWLYACFILQFLSAGWLLKTMKVSGIYRIIGIFIIGLYPPFLARIGHLNLMAHFLIISGITFFFINMPTNKKVLWITLLTLLASLIHFYFVPILAGITFFILLKDSFTDKAKIMRNISYLTMSATSLIIFMFCVGYFSGFKGSTGGLGFYSMNILSPFDAMGTSRFLGRIPHGTDGQYEGFQYFGMGLFLLLLLCLLKKDTRAMFISYFDKYILAYILIITVISISTVWYIGSIKLFEVHLPILLEKALSPFRASGRLFWVTGYIISAAAVSAVSSSFKNRRTALFVLCVAMLFQLAENKNYFMMEKRRFVKDAKADRHEYIDMVRWLKIKSLLNKPIYVDGTWDDRRNMITNIAEEAGSSLYSIGPWIHIRESARFSDIHSDYLHETEKRDGLLISLYSFPKGKMTVPIYKSEHFTIYAEENQQ